MAKLTITDRNLLVDEIERRFKENTTPREKVFKKAIQQEGVSKEFKDYQKISDSIKLLNQQIEKLNDQQEKIVESVERKVGFKGSSYYRGNLDKAETFLVDKYSDKIPSRREIETAILLSSGGDDMAVLMNSVIEQLKNK